MVGTVEESCPIFTSGGENEAVEAGHDHTNRTVAETMREGRNSLLEGPLSPKASTRFRQLLARPGIIVSP